MYSFPNDIIIIYICIYINILCYIIVIISNLKNVLMNINENFFIRFIFRSFINRQLYLTKF